jgi:hypothetical protein
LILLAILFGLTCMRGKSCYRLARDAR